MLPLMRDLYVWSKGAISKIVTELSARECLPVGGFVSTEEPAKAKSQVDKSVT